ncbi:hypothetical protein [Acidocella sp.]|jgi:hypothetical protein|uniref:hypothetical protein n=1 Tax=Acidocella sp. TaxID=50710 RepID=UPI002F3FB35B
MGIAAILGGVGAIGSVAGAANSIFGGGAASSPQTGQTFVPPNQAGEAQNYQNILGEMYNFGQGLPQQLYPQYQAEAQTLTNNPYGQLALMGATNTAGATPQVAGQQLGGATALYNQGQSMLPYANQALAQGFDPQNALYNQQRQGALDQANAINAQSGLGNTPFGASAASDALDSFNTNWQNNLLNRQQTASQTASGINQAAGLDFAGASTLGTGGLSTDTTGFGAPYATSTGQANTGLSGLNSLTNAGTGVFGLPQQTLQDLQSYLNLGQSASVNALAGQNQAFNQNQILGSNLATGLSNPSLSSSLNSLFSSQSPYSQTGGYSGADAGGYGYSGGGSYAAY